MEGFTIQGTNGSISIESNSKSKKDNTEVLMTGYINPPSLNYNKRKKDLKLIHSTSKKEITMFDGIYSIAYINHSEKTATIFQDQYGSNIPIYYSKNDGNIIVSTSLKKIISHIPKKHIQLNRKGFEDFLHNRFIIPNRRTLIKGINKLTRGNKLDIDFLNNRISQTKIHRKYVKTTDINIIESIKNNCKELIGNKTKSALTLSSGYDTNLLLTFLNKNKNITTFTIKGQEIDESIIAKKNSKLIGIKNISKQVNQDTIHMLKKIVDITEGYCFERGIFLQYTLAEELKKNNQNYLIAGDGADQILDQYRFSLFFHIKYGYYLLKEFLEGRNISERFRSSKIIDFLRRPFAEIAFDSELDLILKKNGILANNNKISTIYPFMNSNTLEISKNLGRRNEQKSFYKKKVKKTIDPRIAKILDCRGGTTDIGYIIKGNESRLKKTITQSKLYYLVKKKYDIDTIIKKKNHDLLLRLAYLSLFYNQFIKK